MLPQTAYSTSNFQVNTLANSKKPVLKLQLSLNMCSNCSECSLYLCKFNFRSVVVIMLIHPNVLTVQMLLLAS